MQQVFAKTTYIQHVTIFSESLLIFTDAYENFSTNTGYQGNNRQGKNNMFQLNATFEGKNNCLGKGVQADYYIYADVSKKMVKNNGKSYFHKKIDWSKPVTNMAKLTEAAVQCAEERSMILALKITTSSFFDNHSLFLRVSSPRLISRCPNNLLWKTEFNYNQPFKSSNYIFPLNKV